MGGKSFRRKPGSSCMIGGVVMIRLYSKINCSLAPVLGAVSILTLACSARHWSNGYNLMCLSTGEFISSAPISLKV